jgi:2-polyprenyl-3-methyl-5-hydroxy-6-metoxy-1,4-benzoquinol methylase
MNELARYEALKQPLHPLSPKGVYFGLMRWLMGSLGNLSEGIRIGNTYGFDSGVMLDYVYKNLPSGRLGIGRLIDRLYLESVGWKGIRERKLLIQRVLESVVRRQLEEKGNIRYLDIACGGGEYDIGVLSRFEAPSIEAELRDYKRENIEKAAQNARAGGLKNLTFTQADAFDASNYTQKWDVIVSSGFWEIIEDDTLVRSCLGYAASSLKPGGTLVFTIQPDHPQLEFIARVLKSNTGNPWVMRLRSLELFKAWLEESGLEYVAHRMEPHGIFGVVEAVKRREGNGA